eukprot:CAMPEP_0119555498 /NCGR_PEP_ID=MMETSP1352-20130426/7684_1 /TAXON_ID=265584 /ORGANISM="Stauroneis constricta, Strain CCMP1120" /LENGTH=439 /DNA_ID=CAMNT_0007602265 /DNA_START=75 /DNA_END=1391 /DNA_ORIENTATION=+
MKSTPPPTTTTPSAAAASLSHSVSATSVADFDHIHGIPLPKENDDQCLNVSPPSPFASSWTNMCSGGKILFATDDWFATAENLLLDGPPQFADDLYCEQGKVMDGWETRRRREAGHDWCIIQLSHRAALQGIEIDTAHFTGNHVPIVSLEIADATCTQQSTLAKELPHALERLLHGGVQGTGSTPTEVELAQAAVAALEWNEMLPRTPLRPGFESTRMHYITLPEPAIGTLVRVNYFPDGGVARLRLWGTSHDPKTPKPRPLYMPITTGDRCTVVAHSSVKDESELPSRQPYEFLELSSQANGGQGVACSNKHYGEPWRLTQVTLGKDMGDGWETARHPERPSILIKDPTTHLIRSPLQDWAILKLGATTTNGIQRIILDTKHFRGNYPESIVLEGSSDENNWFPLIQRVRMSPDSEHVFERHQIENTDQAVSYVRLSI